MHKGTSKINMKNTKKLTLKEMYANDHDLTTIFKDEFSKTLDVSNYDVNIKPSRALKIYMI